MEGEYAVRAETAQQRARLDLAAEHLADVLEEVDMEHDPALADAVVAAVSATDRARHVASGREPADAAARPGVER